MSLIKDRPRKMRDTNSTYRTLLDALFPQTLKYKTNVLLEMNLLNNSLTEVLIVSLWLYFLMKSCTHSEMS